MSLSQFETDPHDTCTECGARRVPVIMFLVGNDGDAAKLCGRCVRIAAEEMREYEGIKAAGPGGV